MNERILNLLSLCMQANEKGIDAFFNYSPHTKTVGISIHEKGWKVHGESDKDFDVRIDGHIHPGFWQSVNEAEAYLKGVIECQAQG